MHSESHEHFISILKLILRWLKKMVYDTSVVFLILYSLKLRVSTSGDHASLKLSVLVNYSWKIDQCTLSWTILRAMAFQEVRLERFQEVRLDKRYVLKNGGARGLLTLSHGHYHMEVYNFRNVLFKMNLLSRKKFINSLSCISGFYQMIYEK